MGQELEKTINEVESAAAAFQSIQWPSVDAESNIDNLIDKLSDITAVVNGCQYAVQEAADSARSTGWYVGQELWGAVQSDRWHTAADLAEALEDRLDQIGKQTWNTHQVISQIDNDQPRWWTSANQLMAKIQKEAPFGEMTAAIKELSFLEY